jgi:hypothetical protein
VSLPDNAVDLSLKLATLGGMPYFASIVYKFQRFSSNSFITSGLKVTGLNSVPLPSTAILRPAFTAPYLLSHLLSSWSASSGLNVWSVFSIPCGIALFFRSWEFALLAK